MMYAVSPEFAAAMQSPPTVCRHCGYFLDYAIPKAPGREGWQHSPYRPDAPPPGQTGPCDNPEPTS